MPIPKNDEFIQRYPDTDIGDLIEFCVIDPYGEPPRVSDPVRAVYLGLDAEGSVALWILTTNNGWGFGLTMLSHYAIDRVEIVRKVMSTHGCTPGSELVYVER